MDFDISSHTIFLTVHGSRAYGTNIETSDTDYKGVAIPPSRYFHGYFYHFEQSEELVSKGHPHDKVVYDIRKFFKLAADCNPSIIEVLFTDPKHHRVLTPLGEKILEQRELFLSTKAKFTFSGYAHSQLKRIKTHRGWLMGPPASKPSRADFGLPDEGSKTVNPSVMGAVDELASQGYSFGGEIMSAITQEKKYATALHHWKQYAQWKNNRNPERASLEAKFGYDSKHALHLVRLSRMAVEILEGKGVQVFREDAQELLDIRHGRWSYDQVLEESEKLLARADELYETSPLPKKPPVHKLDDLCISLVELSMR